MGIAKACPEVGGGGGEREGWVSCFTVPFSDVYLSSMGGATMRFSPHFPRFPPLSLFLPAFGTASSVFLPFDARWGWRFSSPGHQGEPPGVKMRTGLCVGEGDTERKEIEREKRERRA